MEKRFSVKRDWAIWNFHCIKNGWQDIYMTCGEVNGPWLKEGGLIDERRSLQILIIAVSIEHVIIGMVLTKGLAMIAHDDKNGSF